MNGSQISVEVAGKVPKAKVGKTRWSFSIVWAVPVITAIVSGYLVYDRFQQLGPKITINSKTAAALRQTKRRSSIAVFRSAKWRQSN